MKLSISNIGWNSDDETVYKMMQDKGFAGKAVRKRRVIFFGGNDFPRTPLFLSRDFPDAGVRSSWLRKDAFREIHVRATEKAAFWKKDLVRYGS